MKSLLDRFLREQGYAVLEPQPDGSFTLVSDAPSWFRGIFGPAGPRGRVSLDKSPFLENFLVDAQAFWKAGLEEACASGTWIEQTGRGKQIPLEAVALCIDGEALLSIHSPQRAFAEQSRVFQAARESMLADERLFKEIQKKEILLHCILHDLSQPLAAIRGCFECLEAAGGAPRTKRFIDIGKQQTKRQENMIREVLESFAEDLKTEMGTGSKPTASADLLVSARETVAAFSPVFEAQEAQLRLSAEIDAASDWRVVGDPSRLGRIFSNLVENALRYTKRNSTVTLRLEEDGAFVRAAVEDEGPGLPAGVPPASLFALLRKGKDSGGKAGLGLYFCRITAERWGGTVGCETRETGGARFWFRLPRPATWAPVVPGATPDQAAEAPARGESEAPPAASQAAPRGGRRVLLADDQPELRQLTSYVLKKEGFRVTAVGDGHAVLDALKKRTFDVVLLDQEMPGMDGASTVHAIRRDQPGKARQIVLALSGHTDREQQQWLLDQGMDGCLAKPLRVDDLRAQLARLLPARSKSLESAATSEMPPEKAALLKRVGGNSRLLRQLVRTFRKDSLKKLRDMKRAITRQDGIALATAAHALKGSAGVFDSRSATAVAERLEAMGRRGELGPARAAWKELVEAVALLREELRGYDSATGHRHRKQEKTKLGRKRTKRSR
jgi:signal transduction histidine kinase/CheY-like chemotaxis protein/HPt (histidine-containing phosphotransfer) domain-containing protein